LNKNEICEKIEKYKAKICIIGLGQVGLPTALTFAKHGFEVIGYDNNLELIEKLNKKITPFKEKGLDDLLTSCVEKRKFIACKSINDSIEKADIIIICVPTPITKEIQPDLSALTNVISNLNEIGISDKLLIIESSIPPGTYDNIILPKIKDAKNIWKAYVPERLSPGIGLEEIEKTPRLIGSYDKDSGDITKILYKKMVQSEIIVSTIRMVELSKLIENASRDVNIAFANEIGLIAEKYNVDVKEVIKISNSHPRVNILTPGPGVGGPCLPKDPYLLLNPQGMAPIKSRLIETSRQINDNMPNHVVELLEKALEKRSLSLSNSNILILGVTYKANISDTRLSPAQKIISILLERQCNVSVFDPHTNESFGGKLIKEIKSNIKTTDAIILLSEHDEFKELDLAEIKNKMRNSILIDTKRMFSNKQAEKLGFEYFAIGYNKTNINHSLDK
jgi:UDP-N-acetyl-D-mannosaminuronic acid dehydrogenase